MSFTILLTTRQALTWLPRVHQNKPACNFTASPSNKGMNRLFCLLVAVFYLLTTCSSEADTRADFLKLIERPRVRLKPQVEELPATNGLAQFHFSFAADAEQRVPGVLVKADNSKGRRAVVIALHGTGGNKEGMLPLCRKLAEQGFIAVAIDGRYHGERTKAGKGSAEYEDAIVRAWRDGREHPFYYDTVWDVMRLVDYLKTRKDVDAKRIGLIGISKGGIETYLAAAVDKRIAVAVPCIGVQGFGWALENNDWQGRLGTIQIAFDTIAREAGVTGPDTAFVKIFYDRMVPGIYAEFDGPAMLPLIAPRPLLIINGDSDNHTPLPGVEECARAAQRAYHAAKADDHFVVRIQQNTRHQVKPESEGEAINWFVKWLKP
jgi:dienelactone hydrolase